MNKKKIKSNIRKELSKFSSYSRICRVIANEMDIDWFPSLWRNIDIKINSKTNEVQLIKWDALDDAHPYLEAKNSKDDINIFMSSYEKVKEAYDIWEDKDSEFSIVIDNLEEDYFEPFVNIDIDIMTNEIFNRFLYIYEDVNRRYDLYKKGLPWTERRNF